MTDPKNLEATNPLICGDGWNDDTAHNIRSAIEFMADAIQLVAEHGFTPEMLHGVNVILRTCAAAIEVCHE